MTKTQAAFCLSAQHLHETFPELYFWTFTFRSTWPDWYYPNAWNAFAKKLANMHGGLLCGLRVLEVHPGGHGLHYHALLNLRVSVHAVRKMGKPLGFGRVQVERVFEREQVFYLAKYLTKDNELWPGMRRWGTVGGFRHCPVSRVECESHFHSNLRQMARGHKVTTDFATYVYRMTQLHGLWNDWPGVDREKTLTRLTKSVVFKRREVTGGVRLYYLDENKCYPRVTERQT